jgi:predicted heme/steroid binding protein
MSKKIIFILFGVIAVIILIIVANQFNRKEVNKIDKPAIVNDKINNQKVSTDDQRVFSLQELQSNDGKNDKPCYVAVEKNVYDATAIKARLGNASNLPSFMAGSIPKLECGTILQAPTDQRESGPDISQLLKQVGILKSE